MLTIGVYMALFLISLLVYRRWMPKADPKCAECRSAAKKNRRSKFRFGDMDSEEIFFCTKHQTAPFFPEK